MAKATAILTGLEAKVVSFDEIGYAGEFDGSWASRVASSRRSPGPAPGAR
jgi:hypothetical protein